MRASPGFFLACLLLAATACTTRARPAVLDAGKPNLIGMNVGGTEDWMPERLYADLIRTSRDFMEATTSGSGPNRVPVDEDGWPMADFSFYVWAGIDQMNGTYALSFIGQVSVSGPGIGNIPVTYDPA